MCADMVGINVRDVVIKTTNLGDELREAFNTGC